MSDFITLTCPTCGGQLQITNDVERFACGHCGNEHIVRRSGGVISLAPVVQEIKKLQTGIDKTASEIASLRLQEEIARLEQKYSQLQARANEVPKNHIASGFWTIVAIVLTVIAIILTCAFTTIIAMGVSTKSSGLGIIYLSAACFTLPALVGAIGLWSRIFVSGQSKRTLLAESKRLEQLLSQRRSELKHHQDIVGM